MRKSSSGACSWAVKRTHTGKSSCSQSLRSKRGRMAIDAFRAAAPPIAPLCVPPHTARAAARNIIAQAHRTTHPTSAAPSWSSCRPRSYQPLPSTTRHLSTTRTPLATKLGRLGLPAAIRHPRRPCREASTSSAP